MKLPRFYPILDTDLLARRGLPVIETAQTILDAGAKILQFRHKTHVTRETWKQMEAVQMLCEATGAVYVINDRADLARLFGAVLHLGQDDLTPSAARQITGPETVIGYSTHNEDQLRAAAAEPVNYVALGPIFGTSSKENPDPTVGLGELRRLRPLTNRPLVAIGGITRSNALEVLAAGADSVAVIGDLLAGDGAGAAKDWIRLLKVQ
jgi:thiamine-phosphate pyrophosphorylase